MTFVDADDQTIDDFTESVQYGSLATKPSSSTAKTGYTFDHWSTTPDGAAYDFSSPVTDDLALYPVFTVNSYTVTFNNDDADGTTTTDSVDYGSAITAPDTPKYSGHTFQHLFGSFKQQLVLLKQFFF